VQRVVQRAGGRRGEEEAARVEGCGVCAGERAGGGGLRVGLRVRVRVVAGARVRCGGGTRARRG